MEMNQKECGIVCKENGTEQIEKVTEEEWKLLKQYRNLCEEKIGESNIKICIENCDGYTEFMKESINILLQSNVFALTFDIGHDYCIDDKDIVFINKNR